MKYLILLTLLVSMSAEAKWKYNESSDEMTDKVSHYLRITSMGSDYRLTISCGWAMIHTNRTGRLLSGDVVFRFGKDTATSRLWRPDGDYISTDDTSWLLDELQKPRHMTVQIDERYDGYEYLRTLKPSKRDLKEMDNFRAACTQQSFLDDLE